MTIKKRVKYIKIEKKQSKLAIFKIGRQSIYLNSSLIIICIKPNKKVKPIKAPVRP